MRISGRGASQGHVERGVRALARGTILLRPHVRGARSAAACRLHLDPDGSSFETSLEITLEEREGKTLMALVEKGFPNAGVRDMHEAGTPHAFDRVDRFIHARGSNEKAGR
jgi:hypothetical protein